MGHDYHPIDPQASVREIERGKKLGAVGVMLLGVTGDVRVDDPPMEPIGPRPTTPGSPWRCIPATAFAPSARSTTRTMTRRRYRFG